MRIGWHLRWRFRITRTTFTVLCTLAFLISGAVWIRHVEQAKLNDSLRHAIENGDLVGVRSALDHGANPNMQHQYGRRPANLIESFKIWWRQHKGEQFYPHVVPQTAIVMALNSRRGRPDEAGILRVLLARGADVNAYDNAAKTPLMSFAEELRTCDDMTPEQGKQDLIFLDVLLHAALDLQDKDGNTALMCAAADGNLAEVRSLLKAGANPDLRNRAGKTAYDQAVELEQDDVVKVLRRTKYKR